MMKELTKKVQLLLMWGGWLVANTDAPDISVTDTLLAFNLVTATNTKRNVVIRWFVKGRWK